MPTLFDTTLELARRITAVRESLATATSTTVLTDALANWAVNFWQGGTIWIDNTTKSLVVTSNTATTVTYPTTTDPSETTKYSLANKDYPRDVLRQAVNQALNDLRSETVDETVPIVDGTTTYDTTYPDILRVELSDGLRRVPHQYWSMVAGGMIYFHDGHVPSTCEFKDLIFISRKAHANLTLDADAIPVGVDFELLVWKAATHALRWGLVQYGQDPAKHVTELLNEAQAEVTRRGAARKTTRRQTILGGW